MSVTHVHPNPGYGGYESGIHRAVQHPQLLNSHNYRDDTSGGSLAPLAELSQIKDWARDVWSGRDRSETTYQFQYPEKALIEPTPSAPTEDERLNKPHPKPVFLTNRLHYVPGYHNADSQLMKSPYRPDRLCSAGEQDYRSGIRTKYDGGVSAEAVRQYAPLSADNQGMTRWHKTLPPNDSWMASGSNRGITGISRSLDEAGSQGIPAAPGTASHTRYLRLAGDEERSRLHRSLDPTHNMDKVPNMMIPHRAQTTIGSQRQMDKSNFQGNPNKPVYRYPRPRGDFLIHPVWPPSMWHHRIPGFRPDPPAGGTCSAYEKHQRTRLSGVY